MDYNNTFQDKALKNAFEAMGYVEKRDEAFEIMDKFNDLIIIHLRFLQPEIDLVSLRYSIMDKIANFGGNFGIFAEITGCSFLGILNFFILLFKITCSCKRHYN